jgi:hypothetical protein
VLTPVKEFDPIDDAIAKEINEAVQKAVEESNSRRAEKASMFYTMPFPGVRYYAFKETRAA